MNKRARWVLSAALGAGAVVAVGLGGCNRAGTASGEGAPAQGPKGKAAPDYASVAKKYNERVELLGRLFARTLVELTFTDEDGKRRSEKGEGFLQVVRPDKLAMSMSKVGKRLFWFGSDGERYWWIDLVDHKKAYVGRHANYDKLRERGVVQPGLGLRPLDVIQMLGTTPLPAKEDGGRTQWSSDGKRIGITVARDAGFVRIWVDPDSYEPSKIELLDKAGKALVVADLSQYEHVELRNRGGNTPRVAQRVIIGGQKGGPLADSLVSIWLAGMEDHRVNDDAFKFDVVLDEVGVAKADVVDLDAQAGGRSTENGGGEAADR